MASRGATPSGGAPSQTGQPQPGSTKEELLGAGETFWTKDYFKIPEGINKRCDLPPEAYAVKERYDTPFARRPAYSATGDNIKVQVNQFRVDNAINQDVWQFDVSISPTPLARVVYKKVWDSNTIQSKLQSCKDPWIYDSHKLAWSKNKVPELRVTVDLDAEEGKTSRKNNTFLFRLKPTSRIRLETLFAYLNGQMDWDNSILECMSFFDHVLRQGPSESMKLIKRTFFHQGAENMQLNQVTEAIKGIYSAFRINESINSGGSGLGINVNVTNQTFWIGQPFEQLVRNFLASIDRKWQNIRYPDIANLLAPVKISTPSGAQTWGMSEAFKALRRLHNIRFRVKHRGKTQDKKEYKIKRFDFDSQYGALGACAKTVEFDKVMPDGKMKRYSIYDYYNEQYKAKLQFGNWPLIVTTKAGKFPFEVCEVDRFNPYPYKLDSEQTQMMIKFAVQRPAQRKQEIMKAVSMLNWGADKYLQSCGIKIKPEMPMVPSKMIKNPLIEFGAKKTIDPKVSGHWDLRNIKFVKCNPVPLKSWAFVTVDHCVDKPTLANFINVFKTTYKGHGGIIQAEPMIFEAPSGQDHAQTVSDIYQACGNQNKQTPQIIFFVLRDKTAWVYDRLKKNADCRWACITQMIQSSHVRKAQGQYCSNVSMKVNSKLGGQTSRVGGGGFFKVPTMIIGVDVSHGSPSQLQPSVASICVSMDKDAAVFEAAVQTNDYRTEILTASNVNNMLGPMIQTWVQKNKTIPQHVFYFRDGVSEGQFIHVMEYEYEQVKKVFQLVTNATPKITIIIATKRHHIRFFPERGDKNGNPLPGTLVEREVTHPFYYDFYLCSHVAIQGTARPVHYNVIHDEVGYKPDDLQRMIYHQCYQYCRSTTPVSLHPAVYYAHLAGYRARIHENKAVTDQVPYQVKAQVMSNPGIMAKHDSMSTDSGPMGPPPPLLPMGGPNARNDAKFTFKHTMWWV
ncbi:ribonuclease H-like domain-containing protein [Lasiosphaeria miniovina]|uniref:Ribonuclease H-like domain-containing protein n=1 Tax=Lasiosphaeria miniovina TaxID=1954250 RepID=A0AA40DR48_9PEZI|nr:ribonuclease H-like domain-containing protein [Lasiosphaeria miniovina]KAK0713074.1 ribonuclease H-like domain-containing protein [Lasiosphaeria miniovina]